MANKVWSGAVDGDIETVGNWVGGAVPGVGDVAVFNQGTQDADTNMDPAEPQWAGLVVTPGYKGNIGGTGNELTVGLTTIKHTGAGELWVKDAGTTTDVYVSTANANTVVNLGGDTMANVTCLRGAITLAGDMGVISRLVVGRAGNVGQVSVVLTAGMSAVTLAKIYSGMVTASATITTLDMVGGRLLVPVGSAGTLTNIIQAAGHILVNSTNTIADLFSMGGITDLGNTEKTVTKSVHVGNLLFNPTIHTLSSDDDIGYMIENQ